MSAPSSIRFTEEGFKALKSLQASTGKTRVQIVSEALVEKHNRTVAMAPVKCRLLQPSEILTLQAEIATIEKLHNDNRRKLTIRTSDKHTTEKIIKAIEKIDEETEELQRLRLNLGKLGQLVEGFTEADFRNIKNLIIWVGKRIETARTQNPDNVPIFETELKVLQSLV